MNTSRGFASLILILIVVGLVVLGGAGYALTRQNEAPLPSVDKESVTGAVKTKTVTDLVSPNIEQASSVIKITSPVAGSVFPADKKVTIKWTVPTETVNSFPNDFNLLLFLHVEKKGDAQWFGSIGDGNDFVAGFATWNLPLLVANNQITSGEYRISGYLQAEPKDSARLCVRKVGPGECGPSEADTAVMARSVAMKVDTGWFVIQSTTSSATIDQGSLTSTSGIPRITGTATNVPAAGILVSIKDEKGNTPTPFGYMSAVGAGVADGHWSARFDSQCTGSSACPPQKLSPGKYQIYVYPNLDGTKGPLLVSGVLTVQ